MTEHKFKFNGTAGEYFGIWIVNILLSIITLGIYGAWAQVRDKTYFYNNTVLDGHHFDYHATGKQIFIGRLIVITATLTLFVLSAINIALYLIGILALLAFLPFIVVRSLRFNMRVSSYRNVRFDFIGQTKDAFLCFIVLPIANIFTLYMCTPFITRAIQRFTTNSAQYGDRPFKFDSKVGPYYAPFLIAIGISVIGFIIAILAPPIALIILVPAMLLYQAWVRNIHFNNTVLDDKHHFKSDINMGTYIWIAMSNAIVALLTLGLMVPWGRVRLMRYLASVTSLETDTALDGYTSSVEETGGVISSEYMDLEGLEIGLGL